MKMSDAFRLPVKVHEVGDQDYYIQDVEDLKENSDSGVFFSELTSSHAAHAINMHDELVEALEMIVDGYSAHDLVDMTGFTEEECQAKIIDILEKAKS